MSSLFLRTLREDPADAEVPSHRLLVRAGYVRRVSAGMWSWMPLGKRVLDHVARVVREEMDAIGAQEVLLPALLPREPYEASGRWEEYGPLLFRLRDRRGSDHLLGPTHEEMFTLLVRGEYSSWKDLPVTLYQVQTKYRDEARPRSGILRGREFVMKDSYSFDLDDEGLAASYAAHREAYVRVFDRLGLDVRVVAAVSGAMGGSTSEEFLAPAPTGEDTFVACSACDYAANVEAAQAGAGHPAGDVPQTGVPPLEDLHTPGAPNIGPLVAHLRERGMEVAEPDTLKTILFRGTGSGTVVAALVPGDREVDVERLAALAGEPVIALEEADFDAREDLVRGYAGPQGMQGRGVRVLGDVRVSQGTSWVTGNNAHEHHARYVVAGRDFDVDATGDLATVTAGDPCPRCGAPLEVGRGIEMGHVFQLGRTYATALDLTVDGPDGSRVTPTMGSYGIGVSRAVAAVVEQRHDERGLVWPRSISPADVHLVALGRRGQAEAAADLARDLEAAGLVVLLDDRGASAGVSFADAELLGVPTVVVVGKGLVDGELELRDRATGERRTLALAGAVAELVAEVRGQARSVEGLGAPTG